MPSEYEYDPMELRIDGVFDVPAAQAIVRALEEAPAERDVRIDLSRVMEFHDFAVAFLAQAIAARRERVTVRGLRPHQLRMLQYLGLGRAAEQQPEAEAP